MTASILSVLIVVRTEAIIEIVVIVGIAKKITVRMIATL
jgi:hypothetical protein